MRLDMLDTQQALGFLIEQTTHIEAGVYRVRYPDIQYPALIPVDTTANEWAKSVTFFSEDRVGRADWLSHLATDVRLADVNRSKFEQGIEMAGIGYRYTLEELGHAQMVPGTNLTADRANSARRAYEEFVDRVAFLGDTSKGWTGLINNTVVTRVDAPNDGTGSSRLWSAKTADQIVRDINDALTGIYTGSNTVELADTLLLPPAAWTALGTTRIPQTSITAWDFVQRNNVYTMKTGAPLTIRGVLGLESAGNSGVGRMVAYLRDPSVLKMHIPMVHRFLSIWQTGPMVFDIPGIFRLGGVEIRRPGAVRYVDGITAAP